MTITTTQKPLGRELARRTLLIQLEAASPISLSLDTLQSGLTIGGIMIDRPTLLKELDYLTGQALIASEPSELSPGLSRYKLSHTGRAYLERENLV